MLVEVLLLHRHLEHADVLAGISAALSVGSVNADVVAVEARKAAQQRGAAPTPIEMTPRRRAGGEPDRAAPRGRCPAMTGRCPRSRPTTTCSERPAHEPRRAKSATTRRGVTEQAALAAIDSGTRMLRLPTIRDRFAEIAAAAEREQLSYLGFLAELVMAECDDRDKRRAARRIHDAGFPRDKRIEEFDFDANPSINPAVIHQLATCAWVKAGHPLCLIGDSGTGKSHLLIGAGHRRPPRPATGSATPWPRSWSTSSSRPPTTSSCPRRSPATAASICLCSDELGYMELDRRGAELLFQVLTEREERSADRDRLQRAVLRLDQDLHRSAALRRHRRPADLRRTDHRDRHHLLPARPRPRPARRRLTTTSSGRRGPWSVQSPGVGHRPAPLPRPTARHPGPGAATGRAPEQHRPGRNSR